MLSTKLLSQIGRAGSSGAARYWPIVFVAIVGTMLALGGYRLSHVPVYEYSNVEVLRQITPDSWWMRRSDGTGEFLYQACHDFPNEKVIWAGYIAKKIRYEEFGNCKSILRSDLGFWWERDKNGNVKEIAQ